MNKTEQFNQYLKQKDKISTNQLDDFFAQLDPIDIEELIGKWQGSVFFMGLSKLEIVLKNFYILKWFGKLFLNSNQVKALIFSFLGIKFNIPGGTAVLRKIEYRGKVSTSMIYNYLPIIDNFRKIDDQTVMGVTEIKGRVGIYFYLKRM